MRNNPEAQAQAAYFQLLALNEKRLPVLKWIHASMNGASASSKAAAAQRKAQGQKAGVADICIPIPRNGYHGAWFELKIKPNRLTPEQDDFIKTMVANGYDARVVWSLDALIHWTEYYLDIELMK